MKASDLKDWIVPIGIAVVGIIFYKKLADAGDKVSKGIADAYVRATAGPVVKVLASAVLPDGRKIPMSAVKITDARNNIFTYGGQRYKLLVRRPDNDYDARLAGFLQL